MSEPVQPASAAKPATAGRGRLGGLRFSALGLLIALVLLFVVAPFLEHFANGDAIEGILLTVVLVAGVRAVGIRGRSLAVALALVVPALLGKWANYLRPDLVPPVVFLAPAVLFLLQVIGHLLGFILRAPRIDSEVLCAGIATYLLLGLVWGLAYNLTARLDPGAFVFSVGPDSSHVMKGFTGLYFSFITLTTVGYGDIAPVSNVARMLAMMEAITGTLYMATLIARLVSLYASKGPSDDGAKPPASGASELARSDGGGS